MRKSTELSKFIIVTCGAILIDLGLYMGFSLVMDVMVSKLCSTTMSCVYLYFMNKKFTFQVQDTSMRQILTYVCTQVINIVANTCANTMLFHMTQSKLAGFIGATLVGTVVNYVLQKYWVFRKN